jgi:sRNA-binding regulator protein Hfq
MTDYPTKETKVKIKLINGGNLTGVINTVGYDRLSDFFEKSGSTFIKVYKASVTGSENSTIILNKVNILYIMPIEPE